MNLERHTLRQRLESTASGFEPPTERHAVVAAILREGRLPSRGPEVLLIARAVREGDPWSGHLALPGGHSEDQDRDLVDTALRETQEEVGLALDPSSELLGRLPGLSIPPIAIGRTFRIIPLVFWLSPTIDRALRANPEEVQDILWVPTESLGAETDSPELLPVVLPTGPRQVPGVRIGERILWGITYRIIRELLGSPPRSSGRPAR